MLPFALIAHFVMNYLDTRFDPARAKYSGTKLMADGAMAGFLFFAFHSAGRGEGPRPAWLLQPVCWMLLAKLASLPWERSAAVPAGAQPVLCV